ncbi:unnamed protein product [Thelazia callipaeda]|uniref:Zinc-hook domain-containing protein n=1 Tax=Thelazia callipaeda TaxID=103827 RepID=A0A0N5D3N2_THECL|nr:unnamed protein product [Thelazia callipaeda]
MSLLDTVELQGIRGVGVGPQNANVIEFLSPLTIICGPNGAGKTTIIEALKYVTTGELPKGSFQAFIHDMRLADRTRVDASVKLKFKDIKGRCCVVTRRLMQSKGAKGKVTNKSEESTIAIEKEPGEWKSLSSKVIDCRKEILNLLGLPAAILEYVVFCHQEESSWPLDEPKKLKERFDEIFQVTGYVKAIEVLKKELKENLHNECVNLKILVARNEKEISLNESALKEKFTQKAEKVVELEKAEMLRKRHDMVEAERQILVDQIKNFSVADYEGNIDELKHEIESILQSDEFENAQRNRERIDLEIETLNNKIKKYMSKKEMLNNEIVQLKSVQMMREKLNIEKKQCLEKCSRNFDLKSEHLIVYISNSYKADLQAERERLQLVCQEEIDGISERLAQITFTAEMKSKECKRLERDISAAEFDLLEASTSLQELNHLQNEISEQEKVLETLQNNERLTKSVQNLKDERDDIASKIEKLKKECRIKENAEEIENKINEKNNELKKFEEQLHALKSKHRSSFLQIFNSEEPEFPLCGKPFISSDQLNIHIRKIMRNLTAAEDEFKIREKEISRIQFTISQISREIDQLSEQTASYRQKIKKFCMFSKVVTHENEVETRLNEVKTLLKKSQQDSGRVDGCAYLYEQWDEEVAMKKCCPLCERPCENTEDSMILREKLKLRKSNLPKEAETLLRKMKNYEDMHNELMEIMPYVGMLEKSNREKEHLQENLIKAEEKMRQLEGEFSKAKSERDTLFEKSNVIRDVQTDASLMDNIWKSVSCSKRSIQLLNAEVDFETCSERSLNEIRKEIKINEERFKEMIDELDMVQAAAYEKNKLIEKLNGTKEQRMKLGDKILRLDSFKKVLNVRQKEYQEVVEELKKITLKQPIVEQELQAKKEERSILQNRNINKEAELMRLLRDLEDSAKELESLDVKLQNMGDGSEDIKLREEDLSKVNTEIDMCNAKICQLMGQIDYLSSKQERKHRLEDQLRKLELQERIRILDQSLEDTKWHGKPYAELKKEHDVLLNKLTELQLIVENKKGIYCEQKKRLVVLEKTLSSAEYAKFKEDFKKEVVKKCVTTKTIEDLMNYIRVVDDSVVKFHAQKMEEINEVLGSLWEKVYHGSDIETIQIKSESAGEMEKKKSYNYRVVMYVNGTEIDMPGRCSAGQKMLASILIRIALSDVFCDKCSIIALDEPTTNLDVLKVENLGDMLADIISVRCSNNAKTFQLIVITHDSRFVEHLRQLCRPEWVYSVSKNSEGLSRVKRHRNLEDAAMREE